MCAHLEIPDVADLPVFFGEGVLLGTSLELEAALVRQMEEADEAEARADLLHLFSRI